MDTRMQTVRHLLDLCRRSERTCSWVYSGFLTPAEQYALQELSLPIYVGMPMEEVTQVIEAVNTFQGA